MLPETLQIPRDVWEAMRRHVQSCLPEEACGLLGGQPGMAHRVVPVQNAAHSATRFRMDPSEQLAAMMELEEAGMEMVAIYHSHPVGPSGFSAIDVDEAAYPEVVYLIWAQQAGGWGCQGFRLDPAGPAPVRIAVLDIAT
jgi:proteasome lid subunit RPN8/RPN11